MKSVKSKLFISYTVTIFLILLFLSLISIYFFNLNKETKSVELLDSTNIKVEELITTKEDLKISNIDKYLDLKNQFLIIFKNEQMAFTNQSSFKTQEILDEVYYGEIHDEHENDRHEHENDRHEHSENRKDELHYKYKEYLDDGFIEIDDYVFTINYFEFKNSEYEVYIGIDERFLEDSIDDVYETIIILNIVIFFVLTALGYWLIGKTINPLKLILGELRLLQNSSDLSKRLKENKTNDEFEELINTFNKMLNNIENSVENIKQFSSDASHELRTPITVIQGEIELIRTKDASKEEILEVLEKVDEEQRKLQEIIENFLLLSRLDKEAVKNNKAILDKVVFEAIETNLKELDSKGLELVLDVEDDLEISFEEKYLNIVVNNLLTNAIKYTNKGSITVKARKENNSTVLEVSDTGIGLSKLDKDKIFERFYRVDKARTSTKDGIGLGLAIVKKICERFNAEIEVLSKIEEGSSFKIIFP